MGKRSCRWRVAERCSHFHCSHGKATGSFHVGWTPSRGSWAFFISSVSQWGAPSTLQRHSSYKRLLGLSFSDIKREKSQAEAWSLQSRALWREVSLSFPQSSKETLREPARGKWPHGRVARQLVPQRHGQTRAKGPACVCPCLPLESLARKQL